MCVLLNDATKLGGAGYGASMRITMETDMAEGQEQFEEYRGFMIRVIAVPEYSPHPPNIPFAYTGYVARPGADVRYAPRKVSFAHTFADLLTAEAAEQAGFAEGRSIIDGSHPEGLNTKGL
jgi:hypothetical protein